MAKGEAQSVITALARLVAEMRVTHRDLDHRLGWSPGLTSRLLRRKDIRIGQLLLLLHELGIDPAAFFRLVYASKSLPARLLEYLRTEQEPLPPLRLPAEMTEESLRELVREAVLQAIGSAK